MLFSAHEHLSSQRRDLAEGRLRLVRLDRNGERTNFLPLGLPPRAKIARGLWCAHSSRDQESLPSPSSAALRPKRVRRRSPSAFRSPSRPRWSRARKQQGEVTWPTSVP